MLVDEADHPRLLFWVVVMGGMPLVALWKDALGRYGGYCDYEIGCGGEDSVAGVAFQRGPPRADF